MKDLIQSNGGVNYAGNPRELPNDPSYPPTEAGQLDNDSVFSASMSFDAAEKSATHANGTHQPRGLSEAQDDPYSGGETGERLVPIMPGKVPVVQQDSAAIKPRRMAFTEPKRWEPIPLPVPREDVEDEFDIGNAQRPIYRDATDEKPKHVFENGEPDVKGEMVSCFDEPGLLYRIVDKKNKTWAFYNDSLAFEVHVTCTFGQYSKIEALENTKISITEDKSFLAQVVVYPGETEMFVKGFVNGFTSRLRALPISDEYLENRRKLQEQSVIFPEMEKVRALMMGENVTDITSVLSNCVVKGVPFVDVDFPPTEASIGQRSGLPDRPVAWFRPRTYIRPDLVNQIRLFRDYIVPGKVEQGELGDCWFMCAIATLAEDPSELMRLFRHPKGADAARAERQVGAYRVTLNHNGLWNSVIVDDYLPAIGCKPKFARSSDKCELWPSILQKAYAKIYGSYCAVQSGDPVQALTDMTGCPSTRFDDAFAQEREENTTELFSQLLQYHEEGYQLILTTPGKAPAFIAGTNTYASVFGDNPELEEVLGDTGLVPGHAYTILDVHQCVEGNKTFSLLKIRNPWGVCAEWEGPWSSGSAEWTHHPHIEAVCHPSGPHEDAHDALWMDWPHVLRYFNGGGVIFRQPGLDYRIPITFQDGRPSLVLELHVRRATRLSFTLSNVSARGLTSGDGALEYPPVMLSLATRGASANGAYSVVCNTSTDASRPSGERWTFLQAREIGMRCAVTPEASPYLLIPRLMDTEDTVRGSRAWFTQLRSKVDPLHYANAGTGQREAEAVEIPAVVGVRAEQPLGAGTAQDVHITFKRLDASNVVFENFPKFTADGEELVEVKDVFFQSRDLQTGRVDPKVGALLF